MITQTTATPQSQTQSVTLIHSLTSSITGLTEYISNSSVPNEELLPFYLLSQAVAKWKKEADALLYKRLKSGEKVDGLTLGEPTITRLIDDPCAAYSALRDYLDTQDIMTSCTLKFGELLKAFTAKYRTGDNNPVTKEEAERIFLEHLENIVSFRTNKEKIIYKPLLQPAARPSV